MLIRLLIAAILTLTGPVPALAQSNVVILSTTTSTQDSGLLDVSCRCSRSSAGSP